MRGWWRTRDLEEVAYRLCRAGLQHVGGGWGQFAHHAASRHGCHMTRINISDQQIAYASELCCGLPVDIVKCDYRELRGTYTRLRSTRCSRMSDRRIIESSCTSCPIRFSPALAP